MEQRPKYAKGRPSKKKPRKVQEMKYGLKLSIEEKKEAIEKKRFRAGCFVLLTSLIPACCLQRAARHGAKLRFSEGSGDCQQFILENSRTDRGFGPGASAFFADMALDGTQHESLPRRKKHKPRRMGQEKNNKTNEFHDDHQIQHSDGRAYPRPKESRATSLCESKIVFGCAWART